MEAVESAVAAQPESQSHQERIYSTQQLVTALQSAGAGLKEQLQVLSILDGTALSWPGVSQAVSDMDYLVELAGKSLTELESTKHAQQATLHDCATQIEDLSSRLESTTAAKKKLQSDFNEKKKEAAETSKTLTQVRVELKESKDEGWQLERQRAELATELARLREENDFIEGELSSCRQTLTSQGETLQELREDLGGRRVDVQHLSKQLDAAEKQGEFLKLQLSDAKELLTTVQAELVTSQRQAEAGQKEAARLGAEVTRLTAELDKAVKEVAKQKEWISIVKKVEGDKLDEEKKNGAKLRAELEKSIADLQSQLAASRVEIDKRDERIKAKEAEAAGHAREASLATLHNKDLKKQLDKVTAEKGEEHKAWEAQGAQLAQTQSDLAATRAAREKLNTQCEAVTQQLAAAKAAHAAEVAARAREAAQVAALQAKLQEATLALERLKAEHTEADAKLRGEAASAAARLQHEIEEAVKEAAVQKALAEGWHRDIRALNEKLAAAEKKLSGSQQGHEALRQELQAAALAHAQQLAAAEQSVKDLRGQLDAAQAEARRWQASSVSQQNAYRQANERIQRENEASAEEIAKLRTFGTGVASRTSGLRPLPPNSYDAAQASTVPGSMEDQLNRVRRLLQDIDAGNQPRHAAPLHTAPEAVKSASRHHLDEGATLRQATR